MTFSLSSRVSNLFSLHKRERESDMNKWLFLGHTENVHIHVDVDKNLLLLTIDTYFPMFGGSSSN